MSQSILLRGGTLIDGTGRDPVRDAAVLIADKRIQFAGRGNAFTDIPPDYTEVDATGLTLLPGLMNLHVHLTVDERMPRKLDEHALEETRSTLGAYSRLQRCIERGVTLLRDLGAPHFGLVKLREAIDAGTLTGPRLLVCGKAICMTGGHAYVICEEVDGPDNVAAAARRQIKAGADFIKIMAEPGSAEGALTRRQPEMTPEEIHAAAGVAHRAEQQIAAHTMSPPVIKLCLDAGIDVVEHGYDLDEECIDRMVAAGTWLIPTVQVYERIISGQDQPGMAHLLPHARQAQECAQRSLPEAIRAGVRIACGTDAGSPNNPPEELIPELQAYVDAGMTHMQALQTATLHAAEMIGLSRELGTIEAGKFADVIAIEGDPLSDITALRNVQLVIKDGDVLLKRTA